jgi:hypothetical protein
MSVITVDVHQIRHTCPANRQPHWFDKQTTIVSVVDDVCRTPVTVRCGTYTRRIPCRRHEPRERQCIACQPLIILRNLTYTDLDDQTAACERIEITA